MLEDWDCRIEKLQILLILCKKVKGCFLELFNTAAIFGLLYSYRQQVPAFISRGATHHTDARDLYQLKREQLPMKFAIKFVIYGNLLGSFTCRKAGTWDGFFYFPSPQRLRLGLNPRTRVPVASMLTTRPPKPSTECLLYTGSFCETNVDLRPQHFLSSIEENLASGYSWVISSAITLIYPLKYPPLFTGQSFR